MKYNKVIGTGGIGSGMLFYSEQSATLGRNESRGVILSDARDYCKLHIIFYYIAGLLKNRAGIYPIGYVGKDESGDQLVKEMKEEGMSTKYIGQSKEYPTMISICLQYPDKDGCNITATNNAVMEVTGDYISKSMDEIGVDKKTIVVAAPEVPIKSRIRMLKKGKEEGALCVLTIPAIEAEEFLAHNIFEYCDILAVNEEEAQTILGINMTGRELAASLYKSLKEINPEMQILVTCGGKGSYSVGKSGVEHTPPLKGEVVNTTGAGDAFLGGTIAGIAAGLEIRKGQNNRYFGETKLKSAVELGVICAGMAIESKDSIAFHVTVDSIKEKIRENGWGVGKYFLN